MNDAARKGRRMVMLIVAGLLAQRLLELSRVSTGQQVFRLGIAVAFAYLLWRGYGWARLYLVLALAAAALLTTVVGLVTAMLDPSGLLYLTLVPLYVWGVWALWSSPAVEAYFEHRESARHPDMSFSTGRIGS
jgi:hypothetical protein